MDNTSQFTGKRRKKLIRVCACGCGKTFSTSFPEKRFFNVAHRVKHWRLTNGVRYDPEGTYSNPEWKELRKAALERDGYACCICGGRPTKPIVHHILYKKNGGPDRLGNLITVCPTCHGMLHTQ